MNMYARKQQIADAFMRLVVQTPIARRVTVADVARDLQIDRKTFYKYFENTDDLSHWIYRDYLKTMLEAPEFARCTLVKPDPSLFDTYADWPFYVRIEGEDHELAQARFYKTMAYHFVGNRAYYSKVFQPASPLCVYDYIIRLFMPAIKDDVMYLLDGREMPEVAVNFLAEYHVMGIFGRLRYHFTRSGWSIMQEEIEPFWNYSHIMLKHTVDSLFEQREAPRLLRGMGFNPKGKWVY